MKKIYLILMTCFILFSCGDKDEMIFDGEISKDAISFEAVPGGALLRYSLPDNPDIFAIQAKYKNFKGETIVCKGTYDAESILLKGFIEEESNVPVEISTMDNKGNLSKSIEMSFSTLKCAASTFFDNLEVLTYWRGFRIRYSASGNPDGFVHVGKITMNPRTQENDTIIVKSFPINEGEYTIRFPEESNMETNKTDVFIWTEDFRGNIVKEKVFANIPASLDKLADPNDFSFSGSSYESTSKWNQFGKRYLFDGDKKGVFRAQQSFIGGYCFLSNKRAVPGDWIIDLKEEKELSRMKLYCPVNTDTWPSSIYRSPIYYMPNRVIAYGSTDGNEWDELGEFYQSKYLPDNQKWCFACKDPAQKCLTLEEVEAADPISMNINFMMTEKKYRYLKFKVSEVFQGYHGSYWANTENRVALMEIEVYEKKN